MKLLKIITPILLLLFSLSCDLVVDKDISKETITLLSPGDKDTNDVVTQNFWWEENKQIEEYRLQIVDPSFSKPSIMYVDTILKNKFNYSLNLKPGSYEWRVRGENSTSKTDYFTRSFKVDSSYNISDFEVILNSPAENAQISRTNSTVNISLTWTKIPIATSYMVNIKSLSPDLLAFELPKEVFTNKLNVPITFKDQPGISSPDISFEWTVTAFNNKSNTETKINQTRTFTILGPKVNGN